MAPELRRLHRLSWLFLTAKSAKGLILPLIVVLFASAANPWARFELLGALFLVPALIAALIKQRVCSYRFAEDELVVRDGILTRKERHIPYERIHNIAVVRNPFHRMLGVASARIETAAGGEPEAVMRVLALEAVDELRYRTLGITATPTGADVDESTTSESGEDTLLEVPSSELVKLGLISGRGGIVFAAVAGVLWQFQWWNFDRFELRRLVQVQGDLPGWFGWLLDSHSLSARVLLGVAAVLLVVVVMRLASVGWHLVRYYGFSLLRQRLDLRAEFGLLTKVSSLIPVHRIQLVSVRTSLLHRWFDRTTIELETAGASQSGSDFQQELAQSGVKTDRQFLAPILERARAAGFLHEILPSLDLGAVEWQRLSPRARRRILKRTSRLVGLLTLLVAILLSLSPVPVNPLHALWLPVLLVPFSFVRATGWLRYSGWGLTDEAVFFRSGWLGRSVSVVPFDKVQTVALTTTFWDRRRDMASVSVDTAGASAFGHRIAIPYLDREVAEEIARRLYAEAESTEFAW